MKDVLEDVQAWVDRGDRVAIERHDRIGEVLSLVGLDPGLDAAAAGGGEQRESTENAGGDRHGHSLTSPRTRSA